ncbi:MAG: hypothetical protein WB810_00615 [Candidatus Cybelea sp.]
MPSEQNANDPQNGTVGDTLALLSVTCRRLAFLPYAIAAVVLLAMIFQDYQRYRYSLSLFSPGP